MEVRQARLARLVERLAVHESEHQDFARLGMLDYCGKQPRGIELRQEGAAFLTLGALAVGAGNDWFLSNCCAAERHESQLVAR
jgi:hypothetical protein